MELVRNVETEHSDYLYIRNILKKGYTNLNIIAGLCRNVHIKNAKAKINNLVEWGQVEKVLVEEYGDVKKYKYFLKKQSPSYYSAAGIDQLGGWQSENKFRLKLTFDNLLSCISKFYTIPKSEILGRCRKREIVICRQMFCYIARKNMPDKSLSTIGRFLNRDHSTVIHSIDAAESLVTWNKTFAKEFNKLNNYIKTNL